MTNKKHLLISIFIIVCSFFSFSKGISAMPIQDECINNNKCIVLCNYENIIGYDNKTVNLNNKIDNNDTLSCESLFGDQKDANYPAYWIQWSLNAMKYIAIVALLVLSTMDFLKAMVKQDKDALQKAITTTAKRFIFAVLIFFLPIIVEFIMNLFGAYGTCGLG